MTKQCSICGKCESSGTIIKSIIDGKNVCEMCLVLVVPPEEDKAWKEL